MVEITFTRKELMSLVLKLDRPSSAKAIIRKGSDGKEYYIQAIESTPELDDWELHPNDEVEYQKYLQWRVANGQGN